MFDFRFNTPIPSLNQGQGSVFMLRECAQSIPRLEKPKNRRFSHKNSKIFDFRFNTPISSLNQGQESVFMLRECAQSILRLEKPRNWRFSHKNPKIFDFRFNTPIPSLNQGQESVFKVREWAQSIPRIELPLSVWQKSIVPENLPRTVKANFWCKIYLKNWYMVKELGITFYWSMIDL